MDASVDKFLFGTLTHMRMEADCKRHYAPQYWFLWFIPAARESISLLQQK
jgi:hypothetical protein